MTIELIIVTSTVYYLSVCVTVISQNYAYLIKQKNIYNTNHTTNISVVLNLLNISLVV